MPLGQGFLGFSIGILRGGMNERLRQRMSRELTRCGCVADFAGFGATADVEGFAGARNLKQAEGEEGDEFDIVASLTDGIQRTQDSFAGLLSNDGLSGLGDSKKEKFLGGLGDKGFKDGKFGFKDKKGKKDLGGKYDKTKGVLSRILNLMGVDVGPDPLQDLINAGERQRDSTAQVAGAFSSVLSSNVDNVMNERQNVDAARENLRASKRGMNDVRIQNEADRWKAILRNFINIDKGFSDLEEEARKFADDTCAPAEFVPPERLPASFSGDQHQHQRRLSCEQHRRHASFEI
ncbi:hypothetical protein BSKO_07920 [Bryopsis sp. KO-2023]|nr:hypothetical protein BSKO_07920 [Bryopsis sp. KO-2023]